MVLKSKKCRVMSVVSHYPNNALQLLFESVHAVKYVSRIANTTIRYDKRCYFNMRSKADISQLNLPHETKN